MLAGAGPLLQTVLGTGLTWAVTALGSLFCVFQLANGGKDAKLKRSENMVLDGSLGFSAGVMLAASFWSLLTPAIDLVRESWHTDTVVASATFGGDLQWQQQKDSDGNSWAAQLAFIPPAIGIVVGALFVAMADFYLPVEWLESPVHAADLPRLDSVTNDVSVKASASLLSPLDSTDYTLRRREQCDFVEEGNAGVANRNKQHLVSEQPQLLAGGMNRRLWLLIIAITLHNIPEGVAVGIAFGGIGSSPKATFAAARNLAVGIAIQNFPEGLAVSLPLRAAGYSVWRSVWYGQLSGMVEPISGVIGCLAVQVFQRMQPYALGFAAGAMLFVVFDDVIPEAHSRGNGRLASFCAILGFIVMMALDVGTTVD